MLLLESREKKIQKDKQKRYVIYKYICVYVYIYKNIHYLDIYFYIS